jgi:hypothetical protein
VTYQRQQDPVAASPQAEGRTWVWALVCAVAVLLLCIGGGVALALSAKRYGQRADQRALATPATTLTWSTPPRLRRDRGRRRGQGGRRAVGLRPADPERLDAPQQRADPQPLR